MLGIYSSPLGYICTQPCKIDLKNNFKTFSFIYLNTMIYKVVYNTVIIGIQYSNSIPAMCDLPSTVVPIFPAQDSSAQNN